MLFSALMKTYFPLLLKWGHYKIKREAQVESLSAPLSCAYTYSNNCITYSTYCRYCIEINPTSALFTIMQASESSQILSSERWRHQTWRTTKKENKELQQLVWPSEPWSQHHRVIQGSHVLVDAEHTDAAQIHRTHSTFVWDETLMGLGMMTKVFDKVLKKFYSTTCIWSAFRCCCYCCVIPVNSCQRRATAVWSFQEVAAWIISFTLNRQHLSRTRSI